LLAFFCVHFVLVQGAFCSPRITSRPTAEALLQAFRLIHLSVVTLGQQNHRHLTPLSELQLRILGLLDVSPVIYGRLGAESPQPP
jgi:hypothetical protein